MHREGKILPTTAVTASLSHTRKVRLGSRCCITANVYCQLLCWNMTHNEQERIREEIVTDYIKVLKGTWLYGLQETP
jgi:hypothetical protein